MSNPGPTGGGLRKVRRDPGFVQVDSKTVRDRNLSFRARGVLVFLLDHPDGFDVRASYIAGHGKEGRDAVEAALRELRAAGYYRLERRQFPDGTFTMGTAIAELPQQVGRAAHKAHNGRAVSVRVLPTGDVVELEPSPAPVPDSQGPAPVPDSQGPDALPPVDRSPQQMGETDRDTEGGTSAGDVTSAPSPTPEAPTRTCHKAPAPHGSCGACADDRRALEAYEAALNADALTANRAREAAERAAQAERRALADVDVENCHACDDAGIALVHLDGEEHRSVCQHSHTANVTAVRARLAIRAALAGRQRRADSSGATQEHRARTRARDEHTPTEA